MWWCRTDSCRATVRHYLDLLVALATGAAGGYALVREEDGTSLPDVAVAVALLPPLAVAGACVELGRSDLALGQGCCTSSTLLRSCWQAASRFWLSDFKPGVRVARISRQIVLTVALSLICSGVLAVPLTRSLQAAVRDERAATAALEEVAGCRVAARSR
jgi:uncharacterized membrane protein